MRYKYMVVREMSQEKMNVRYKYMVMREMSQEKDKCGRRVEEGAYRNSKMQSVNDSEIKMQS